MTTHETHSAQPPLQPPDVSDDVLIAYLDGVLPTEQRIDIELALASDGVLSARLAALTVDTRAMAQAFETLLLRVPSLDLPTLAPHAIAIPLKHAPTTSRDKTPWALAAGVVAAVSLSFAAGRWLESPSLRPALLAASNPDIESAWRLAVVAYQRLYVRETLAAGTPPDAAAVTAQLANVSNHSGLVLKPPSVELPGLSFRRAQTLGIDGRPLIQMAYVSDAGEPVALCFTRSTAPVSTPAPAVLNGMNTVSWNDGNFGFVLVGHVEAVVLLKAAQAAARQIKHSG